MNFASYLLMCATVLCCMVGLTSALPDNVARRIGYGDLAYIERYLVEGGDANASVIQGDYEFSLLYFAAMEGEYEIAKLLLNSGANPNHYVVGSTILRHLDVEIESLKEREEDVSVGKVDRYMALKSLLEQFGGTARDDEKIIGDIRRQLLQSVLPEDEHLDSASGMPNEVAVMLKKRGATPKSREEIKTFIIESIAAQEGPDITKLSPSTHYLIIDPCNNQLEIWPFGENIQNAEGFHKIHQWLDEETIVVMVTRPLNRDNISGARLARQLRSFLRDNQVRFRSVYVDSEKPLDELIGFVQE